MNRLRTILADWLFSLSLVLERWSDAVRPMPETGITAPYDGIAVTTHEYAACEVADLAKLMDEYRLASTFQERLNKELRKETDRAVEGLTTVTTEPIYYYIPWRSTHDHD